MSSILQYNNVSLPFVKTEKFTQEVVYSPDGVDVIYTKVTIGVGCVLSPCMLNNENPATWINNNKAALMARGAQLYFMMDGTWILNPDCSKVPTGTEAIMSPNYQWNGHAFVQPNDSDANLGPKPLKFDVRAIEGNAWVAYYEIETYIPYCSGTPTYFLSNRWSVDIDIDDQYFIKRIISGVLVLNGQFASDEDYSTGTLGTAMTNMVFDNVIIPPIPKRWKREGVKIVRSSDGLIINYQITDQQLYAAMPYPCTKIDAQYTETAGSPDGKGAMMMNVQTCEVNVTVYGQPTSNYDPTGTPGDASTYKLDYNKYDLMKIMFQVVFSRIPFPFLLNGPTDFSTGATMVTYFQMKEDMFKPIVGCVLRVLKTRLQVQNPLALTLASGGSAFSWTMIGSTIPIGDVLSDVACQPINIGNYGLLMFTANILNDQGYNTTFTPCELASALLTPCSDAEYRSIASTVLASGYYNGNINYYSQNLQTGGTQNVNDTAWTKSTQTQYSTQNYKHPFTEYTIDVQYVTDQHMMQLPVMYDIYPFNTTPASGCVFAQTSAPTTRKIVHFKAARVGTWPMSPIPTDIANPASTPSGDQVLNYNLTYADSQLLADGVTRKYEVGGVYEAGLSKRLQWDQTGYLIPTNVVPITNDVWGSQYSTYPASMLVSGIIGYGTSSPGA